MEEFELLSYLKFNHRPGTSLLHRKKDEKKGKIFLVKIFGKVELALVQKVLSPLFVTMNGELLY